MNISLYVTSENLIDYANEIGQRFGVTVQSVGAVPDANELALVLAEDGLSLRKDELSVMGDFGGMKKRLKHNNLTHEMLVKASKYKGMEEGALAIDATAGLGEDSILLAAAGFKVLLFERDNVIAALLSDALKRGLEDEELEPVIRRMELRNCDSIEALKSMTKRPEVIYLDPMFPERQKSGLIKKKFQLLQLLESPCSDGEEMVNAAIAAMPRRLVIKRPLKAEKLAGVKPSFSLEGKAIRYDCLAFARE